MGSFALSIVAGAEPLLQTKLLGEYQIQVPSAVEARFTSLAHTCDLSCFLMRRVAKMFVGEVVFFVTVERDRCGVMPCSYTRRHDKNRNEIAIVGARRAVPKVITVQERDFTHPQFSTRGAIERRQYFVGDTQ